MTNRDKSNQYILYLARQIPNLLQIITFEAFLAVLIHDPLIIGFTTSILCGAYLGARHPFPDEDYSVLRGYRLADLVVSGIIGLAASLIAIEIVKVIK